MSIKRIQISTPGAKPLDAASRPSEPKPSATAAPPKQGWVAKPRARPPADDFAKAPPPRAFTGGTGQVPAGATHGSPCPMLAGLEAQGYLQPNAKGEVSLQQLDKAFKEGLGMSAPMRAMFQLMAPVSTDAGKLIGNLFGQKVDVGHLRGDFFDHRWDSGILRDGKFNEDAFQRLASKSTDGKTLTVEQWAAALGDSLQAARDAGEDVPRGPLGTAYEGGFVGFEAGLIFSALGKKDASGTMRVSLEDVQRLYRDKQLPPDWKPQESTSNTNLRTLLGGAARAMFELVFGSRGTGAAREGERLALGRETSMADPALTGAMLASCPHAGKSTVPPAQVPTDPTAVAAVHDRAIADAGAGAIQEER